MASSLSNFVNNLAEGIHEIKCKYMHDNEKSKMSGIKLFNTYTFSNNGIS